MNNRYFIIFAVISLLTLMYGIETLNQSKRNQEMVGQDESITLDLDESVIARTSLD